MWGPILIRSSRRVSAYICDATCHANSRHSPSCPSSSTCDIYTFDGVKLREFADLAPSCMFRYYVVRLLCLLVAGELLLDINPLGNMGSMSGVADRVLSPVGFQIHYRISISGCPSRQYHQDMISKQRGSLNSTQRALLPMLWQLLRSVSDFCPDAS